MSDGRLSEHAVFEVADIVSAASLAMNLAWRWDVIAGIGFLGASDAPAAPVNGTAIGGAADAGLVSRDVHCRWYPHRHRNKIPHGWGRGCGNKIEVEDWVEENSVCALRFEVDGRAYILEAGEPDWSVDLTGTRDGIALTGR